MCVHEEMEMENMGDYFDHHLFFDIWNSTIDFIQIDGLNWVKLCVWNVSTVLAYFAKGCWVASAVGHNKPTFGFIIILEFLAD